jgi:hypothetical protein
MANFDSKPIPSGPLRTGYKRADVVFHEVDQAVPSYEARIFVDNPEADAQTAPTEDNRYLGSFFVFGKFECWGEEGHCDEPVRTKFDRRRNPTRYAKFRVRTRDGALAKLAAGRDELTLNIVAVLPKHPDYESVDPADALRFSRVSIVTYA